jgi:hypothetical protein
MLLHHVKIILSAIIIHWGAVVAQSSTASIVTKYYHGIDTLLANPHKGAMVFDGKPWKMSRFPSSIAYFRFDWAELQPARDSFCWDIIDTLLVAYKDRGMRFAFRIMTTDPQAKDASASPGWLYKLGCRNFEYVTGGSGTYQGGEPLVRIEPDYSDPVYLAEHGRFIRELGRRYDGNDYLEFVDIGSYGIWGEWHTQHPVNFDIREKIVDMYIDAFPHTQLMMMAADHEVLPFALSKETGIRRDGIGSLWDIKLWGDSTHYPQNLKKTLWKKHPVAFEWYGDYAYLTQCDHCSFERGRQFMIENHVTYINDNIGAIPDSIFSLLRSLMTISGYSFILSEISNPEYCSLGDSFILKMKWANVGVAPLYKDYLLSICLIDENGNIVSSQYSRSNIREWIPGTYDITEPIKVDKALPKGIFTIGISMVNADTKRADIRFPINAFERNGVYYASKIEIK